MAPSSRPRICHAARALARAAAAGLVLWALAGTAAAGAGDPPGTSAVHLLAARADDAVLGMVQSNCLGRDEPRPFTSTFFGLPEGEPHFGEQDRRRLNRLVGDALRASEVLPHVDESNTFGSLAAVLTARKTDQADLAEALSQIRSSSIPLILRASRPAPNVASLRLIVFARGDGDDYRCSRSVSLAVDLDTLEPVTEPRSSMEYLSLSGAFSRAFADLAGALDPERLAVFEPVAEPAACPALQRLADRFLDGYVRHRSAGRSDLGAPTGLPPLAWGGAPQADAPVLEFRVTREARDSASLRMTLLVREGGARRLVAAYDVATTDDILPPCPQSPGEAADIAAAPGNGDDLADGEAAAPASVYTPASEEFASEEFASDDGAVGHEGDGEPPAEEVVSEKVAGEGLEAATPAGERAPTAAVESAAPQTPVCRESGEILALSVSPGEVWPGDMLTVFATVRGCTPTFFNVSEAGVVTPIPTHIFETDSFQDAVTFELSPGTRFGLRVEEQDPAGRHWLGLFCSSCRTNVDRATLAEWIRAAGLPARNLDEHATILADDVRMAADAYVKAD